MMKNWTKLKLECPVDISEEVKLAKEIERDLMQLDWFPNYEYAIKNLLRTKNNLQILITNIFHLVKIHKTPEGTEVTSDIETQVIKIIKEDEEEDETETIEEGKEESFARILKILDKKEENLTSVTGGAIRIKASNPQAIGFKEEIQAILRIIFHSLKKSTSAAGNDAELFSQHIQESLQDKFSLLGAETREKKGFETTGKRRRKRKK